MNACLYCDSPHLTQYIGNDGGLLCEQCARREISGLLNDMDPEELKKLRRQIEDRLRKSPQAVREIAISLAIQGEIGI